MSENTEIKWYVVHTYSGYEKKVKDSLLQAAKNNGMQDRIIDVQIPVEEVVEIKNNRRRVVERKLLPGYVMVRMLMTEETWYVVRNTRGVTGFVGSDGKPVPLSDTDFAAMCDRAPTTRTDIQVGDTVRILSGLFENFVGRVSGIDPVTQRLTVTVPMLESEAPVDLAYDEVVRED